MSKDKIEVNMNVYDIPILVEALEEANKEIERLNKNIKDLEILVECLYLKVTLNQEQEELLNKIILGSDKE